MEKRVVGPPPAREPSPADGSALVELSVGGMHCQSCVALIEETLIREPGVQQVTVDLEAARASVTFDGSSLSVDDLCATVASVGYSASPLASGDPGS